MKFFYEFFYTVTNFGKSGEMDKDFANCAGGLRFDSHGGQIEHSIANGLPALRSFFRAVLPWRLATETGSASHYTRWRKNREYTVMKIWFFYLIY